MYLGGVEKEVFLRDLGRDFQELLQLFQPHPRLFDEPGDHKYISFDQDIKKFFVFVFDLSLLCLCQESDYQGFFSDDLEKSHLSPSTI